MNHDTSPAADHHGVATLPRPESPPVNASEPRQAAKRTRKQLVIFAIVLALLSAASLILLLTITGGQESEVTDADVTVLSQREVTDALLREGAGPGDLGLEVLYTPDWYYTWSGRPLPVTDGSPTLAFFMFETVHAGDLTDEVPVVTISGADGSVTATSALPVSVAPHHRVTQLLFPAEAADGLVVVDDESPMVATAEWGDGSTVVLEWEQPMPFGLGIINGPDDTTTFRSPALSLGAILAIFGGMLAALSPCLLLLAAYYTAVLSATAAIESEKSSAERRLLATGLWFVAGFTAIYTAGGVVAGWVGASVSRFDNIDSWTRPISIIAGVIVVTLGIRMASQARVPMVCKIPGFNRPTKKQGKFGAAVMGSTFAVGCLSCFSATVLTALLLYAGATGSPLAGGLVMLMFSAGVGLMFLVAAVFVAKAAPLATWLTKAQPVIGVVSAIVMIFLGGLMIADKFHIFTGYLYELWS
jgi:cytochrome c-type biogenesis protein